MLKHIYIKRFRNFRDREFNISSRLNLISGANGIGKSTLLGILASGSGTKQFKTLSGKKFHPEFDDYFILTKDEHVDSRMCDDYYETILTYNYKEHTIRKRLRTSHPKQNKLKLVPRTINEKNVNNKEYSKEIEQKTGVTEAGRIPIPTIFVSMSRLYPIGESGVSTKDIVKVLTRKNIYDLNELIKKYVDMYNYVLPESINNLETVSLFETNKPKINYGAFYVMSSENKVLTQSIGQDSLSGILSALLSFHNISYSNNYHGGLLCIDELDASLHPDAQKRLLKLLEKESERLNLQIIFTSHSLTIIKEMIKLTKKDNSKHSVIYFRNKSNPYPKYEQSYIDVKADLFQQIHHIKPKVKVYLEDQEAKFYLEKILELYEKKTNPLYNNIFSNYELIVSEISCNILLKLPNKDDYFKDTIIVLDGDAKYKKKPKIKEYLDNEPSGYIPINNIPNNVLFLPGEFSPEEEIFKILYTLAKNEEKHEDFWSYVETLPGNYYAEIIRNKMKEMINQDQLTREPLKIWFNEYKSFFNQSDIYNYYFNCMENENILKSFGNKFYCLLQGKLNNLLSKGF